MDAKRKYTRLVEKVKHDLESDEAFFKKIKERNRNQEKYKELWEKVNIDEVVKKFAPGSEPIINENGKIIFKTPNSNIQVVAEATIGSVRIQDLTMEEGREYLDLNPTPSYEIKRLHITENGKTRGLPKKEYELKTHFRIKKLNEM